MSEENRFIKNKKVFALSISLVVMCVLAGVFGISFALTVDKYDGLSGDYDELYIDYLELLNDFNRLDEQYFILTGEHIELEDIYNTLSDNYRILLDTYNTLSDNYNNLSIAYDSVCDIIKQSILPVQYCFFAESVRRYYMPIYCEGLSGKLYWKAFAEFCRDIILHDSGQYNAFSYCF